MEKRETNALAEFLTEHRKNKAMTQQEFCGLVGLSRSNYAMLEKGNYSPGIKAIERISFETGKSVKQLRAMLKTKIEAK